MQRNYDYAVMFAFEHGMLNGEQFHDLVTVERLWWHFNNRSA